MVYLLAMTNDEFDKALDALEISSGDAAKEMATLGDAKTSTSYVSAMRAGRKPVTQAAAIYVRLKMRGHNGGPVEPTNAELLDMLKARLK